MAANSPQSSNDDEYKKATKVVVDDMFRDDILGPRMCSVLENHTPASTKVQAIIADAITREPTIKSAIESVVNELDTKRKSRWIDKLVGAIWTIVIGTIVALIVYFIKSYT